MPERAFVDLFSRKVSTMYNSMHQILNLLILQFYFERHRRYARELSRYKCLSRYLTQMLGPLLDAGCGFITILVNGGPFW